MKAENIGNYLRLYRKDQKKTLKDVAESIDVSSSYISQIENGVRYPSDQSLYNILMKAFDLRPTEAEDLIRKWRIKSYSGMSEQSSDESLKVDTVLPFYKNIDSGFDNAQPDAKWPFFLEDKSLQDRLFIWQMDNDSMEPRIPHNAYLIVNRDVSELTYNTIVLVLIDGKATVRYFQKRDEAVKLIAANSAYPVFFGQNVRVIGRVVKMIVDI